MKDLLFLFAVLTVGAVALTYYFARRSDCEERGGVLIKTGCGYACIKAERVP